MHASEISRSKREMLVEQASKRPQQPKRNGFRRGRPWQTLTVIPNAPVVTVALPELFDGLPHL